MLDRISISGFKSIKELCEFELNAVNVLIGANGAGKSNFIDFFRMVRAMFEFSSGEFKSPSLATYIEDKGGMANLLFNGPKTKQIKTELIFNQLRNGYRFELDITSTAGFLINNEAYYYSSAAIVNDWQSLCGAQNSPKILDKMQSISRGPHYRYICNTIKSWQIYHFHDTSRLAGVRMPCDITDNKYFRFDASNLAAFLYALKEGDYEATVKSILMHDGSMQRQLQPNQVAKDAYERIVDAIKAIAPYFEDFILLPPKEGKGNIIKLQWKQKGSDLDMQVSHLSDGTLRFICLATALLQPNPPELILIDEPELGLHPEALVVLAELIELSKDKTQIILSTQSPAFADLFAPEDIITVKRVNGATTFERLNSKSLKGWLDKFSIGQLWRKNVIKGGVVNE